ncbi:MAG: DUF2807 domain-containing protein, partial [Chitinophagaceae bacterium]|nr:DUF2807 domain-containing protein [Chitinophagaceae bacterium]
MKNNKLVYGIGLILLAVAVIFIGYDYSKDSFSSQTNIQTPFTADSIEITDIQILNSKANCRIEIIPSENEFVLFSYDHSKYKNNSTFANNELTINFQSIKNINLDLNSSPKIKVKIHCKSLNKVLQTGVGDILNHDTLRAEQLIIQNKGVGDIKLTVNVAQETHVTNEGVGDIELKGKTRFVKLENRGSGDIEADYL